MLRFSLLLLLQLGVAHFQNCPLSKTFLQCDKGTGGRRFFGSDLTHWDPDTVIDAGMDQHYDCRACCRDESVCSIPQCDTGLTSPGCDEDQGPEIVNEDLPSPEVFHEGQDQGPALPRPSHEIVDPQVSRDRQMDRTQRPSDGNNFALCGACKQAVHAIKAAKRNIGDEQTRARKVNEILNNRLCYLVDQDEYRLCQEKVDHMRNLRPRVNPTTVCTYTQFCPDN